MTNTEIKKALAELKQICGAMEYCKDCPFSVDSGCSVDGLPEFWLVEEGASNEDSD